MTSIAPNSLHEVRVHAEIGDDPEELHELADAVVRGCSICYARIKSLRLLLEAVHAHPGVQCIDVVFDPKQNDASTLIKPDYEACAHYTNLRIYGGEILDASCRHLIIRINVHMSSHFSAKVDFACTHFLAHSHFDRSVFANEFCLLATHFYDFTTFRKVRFRGSANIGSIYHHIVRFDECTFHDHCGAVTFFESNTVVFYNTVMLKGCLFPSTLALGVRCEGVVFGESVTGDFRLIDVSTCRFGVECARRAAAAIAQSDEPVRTWNQLRHRIHVWSITAARDLIGWHRVRSLGEIQVLNRASVFGLIAIPILASLWPAISAAWVTYRGTMARATASLETLVIRLDAAAQQWGGTVSQNTNEAVQAASETARTSLASLQEFVGRLAPDGPYLGSSLALLFMAAVCVTIGLLLYQMFAPREVRKQDEDEFVEAAHRRYPEHAVDRNDGLRRAIDFLESVAARRGDRNASFVQHHGEAVWIPSRRQLKCFDDPAPEDVEKIIEEKAAREIRWTTKQDEKSIAQRLDHERRMCDEAIRRLLPGAERRRIVIEEGARAEYWSKCRQNLTASALASVFYVSGLICLLVVLSIQTWRVLRAAGWF